MPRGLTNLALAIMEFLESEGIAKGAANAPSSEVVPAGGSDSKGASHEPLVVFADQKDVAAKKDELVKARAYLSTDKLPAGGTCQIVVLLEIKEGWHINANPPEPEHMIPTKFVIKSKMGTKMTEVIYPKGHGYKFEGEEKDVQVYEKEAVIRGTLTIPDKIGGQSEDLEISITYQACKENECLPPKTIKLTGALGVANRGESVKSINARLFPKLAK